MKLEATGQAEEDYTAISGRAAFIPSPSLNCQFLALPCFILLLLLYFSGSRNSDMSQHR